MTATLDPTEHATTRNVPASDGAGRQMWVRHYPTEATAVVTVRGECDELAAPRLAELLGTRLQTTLGTVVVDLSGVEFLGVAALETLTTAAHLAAARSITLKISHGPPCVERALAAAGLTAWLEATRAAGAEAPSLRSALPTTQA